MQLPHIAIPVPHSQKLQYDQRALPQYLSALEQAGGEPLVVQLEWSAHQIAQSLRHCQGVLLPGSSADLDPQKYGEAQRAETVAPDVLRDAADELLLQDAFNLRKPILGICYGLQSLNVWRTGTLVQDIAAQMGSQVNHAAGEKVARAHAVAIAPGSKLAAIVSGAQAGKAHAAAGRTPASGSAALLAVNSSHHQAAAVVGDGLRVAARCPEDQVIEALEGSDPAHFVLAVQWHPERNCAHDPASQALFKALIAAAR